MREKWEAFNQSGGNKRAKAEKCGSTGLPSSADRHGRQGLRRNRRTGAILRCRTASLGGADSPGGTTEPMAASKAGQLCDAQPMVE